MITIPLWLMVALPLVLWILSAASNAMSLVDRSFYGWVYRFGRILTASAPSVLEKELHISVPTFPTSADVSNNPSAPPQN